MDKVLAEWAKRKHFVHCPFFLNLISSLIMHYLDIGLAFIEGLALIASPCILPILPLVLGASLEGGKKRPFGVILGFVLAFAAVAMFSRQLVALLGLNLDFIKYGSLLLLTLFGLILLSEKLSLAFSRLTQGLANKGSQLSSSTKEGFGSGILLGILIGLIWTPCAGPILAAVLVQIIRQENNLNALLVLVAFAIGTGLPMLLIAFAGRAMLSKILFLSSHAEALRKGFGILILLAVALIASGYDSSLLPTPSTKPTTTSQNTSQNSSGLQDALANPYLAPEFEGIESWLNSNPLTMSSLRGKVVLVDFWTYSCINCVRTLPIITKWDRTYRDKGLVIIGVHSPEFEFEKNVDNVKNAIKVHQIEYPVALDNKLDTWTAFKNQYWPAHYLIDKEGRVVYTHFGEGHYMETENNIRQLLGLSEKTEKTPERPVSSSNQTPETYLGYSRTERFSSPENMVMGQAQNYTKPESIPSDHWALEGLWMIEKEHILAKEAKAKIFLNFTAGKVFLVMGSDQPLSIDVLLNGKPLKKMSIHQHTLYQLVDQDSVKNGLLEIICDAPGLEVYSFTFGM